MMMRTLVVLVSSAVLAGAGPAQHKTAAPPIAAQDLVTRFLAAHGDVLSAVELALIAKGTCRTVAATHVEDVGERCDDDERTAMRSGRPYVEAPTRADPIYDVTQALHDANGKLIGAVGMDLKPLAGDTRDAVVARAAEMRRLIEAEITSTEALLRPTRR
jgi:hypothetical protein